MKKEVEFSKECKIALWEKLIKAIAKEKLRNKEVSDLLRVNPVYIAMIRNPKAHGKCANAAWRRIQEWANSGDTIKKFSTFHAGKFEYVGTMPVKAEKAEPIGPKKKAEFKKITQKEMLLQSAEDRNKSFESLWNQYQADQQDGFVSNLDSWLEKKYKFLYPGITFEEAKAHIEQCIAANIQSLPKLPDEKDPAGGPFIIIYDDDDGEMKLEMRTYGSALDIPFAEAVDYVKKLAERSFKVDFSAKIVSFKTIYEISRQVVEKSYV